MDMLIHQALLNQGMNANFAHIQKSVWVWVLKIVDKTIHTPNQQRLLLLYFKERVFKLSAIFDLNKLPINNIEILCSLADLVP